MTLQLRYANGACSFVPHAMLELAGATFEPVVIRLGGVHCGPLDAYALTLLRWGTIAGIRLMGLRHRTRR